MTIHSLLPHDWSQAQLLGRLDFGDGPTPVLLRDGRIEDMSPIAATVSELMNLTPAREAIPRGRDRGAVEELTFRGVWQEGAAPPFPRLLAPIDLQCLKAAGVTFAVSTLERVIEERARGDAAEAQAIRDRLATRIGGDLRGVRPGSEAAARLKAALIADGLWSQYLEVAIGPDAEIFTKGPVLSARGWGEYLGVRSDSHWNNPEPEVVLLCDGRGDIRGATLGNDVNLRDFEGRSALLLSKAKDNNASTGLGPFVRLFDDHFTLDDVRNATVGLEIEGRDQFVLRGESHMGQISRDPAEIVAQAFGPHHQYPDGFALFLGTMFAPTEDRDSPGQGFTHKVGDRVRIRCAQLGALENEITTSEQAPPWSFGISALMRNLSDRGLLQNARRPE